MGLQLQDLVDSITDAELPEGYSLSLLRISPEVVLGYEVPGMPEVSDTARYLAINYVTGPQLPGVAKFDTIEEAISFVDRFGPVDYEKVLEFAAMVHKEGWQDGIYSYTDEWVDELPAEADGKPYWVEMPDFEDAELVTTVNESDVGGSHKDIAQPEDKAAILVKILADDVGGESHVEMAHPLEVLGIEEDSFEELLAESLVVNDRIYAFVRRDLMAAVWLLPVPENLEYLEVAVEGEDFKRYYDENAYVYGGSNINERKEAVRAWLTTVGKETDWRGYDEKDRQEFNALLMEWITEGAYV